MKTPILALAALGAALSGCVLDNYASPEVLGMCQAPAPDSTTGACTYSSTCGAFMLSYWYDPTYGNGLVVPLEFFNQLPNNRDVTAYRVNTNDAVIELWEFDYAVGDPTATYATFGSASVPTTVVVPAGGHTVVPVPVVYPGLAAPLSFFVNVRAKGRYLDDRIFETGAFPVQVLQYTPYVTPTLSNCTTGYVGVCPQPGQAGTAGCVTG